MKILFVSQYYSPEPFSNAGVVQALTELGHEVEVLTALPNYPEGFFYPGYDDGQPRTEFQEGVRVTRVRTTTRGSSRIRLALNYLSFVFWGSIAAQFSRFERPNVIFLSQLSPVFMAVPAIILSRRFRVPLVYWVQDIWPESAIYTLGFRKEAFFNRVLTWISGALYRAADMLLVQNSAMPPLLMRFGIPQTRIAVFPNTSRNLDVDVADLDCDAYQRFYPDHGFRIVYAGNIGQSQGFDTLLAAATDLRGRGLDVQWTIIGEGRDRARIEGEVERQGLGDCIHFLGRHPEAAMPCFYKHANAMLLILKANEVFNLTVPYKLQSYLAAGKPIVGSVDGETARIINATGAGVTAPAEDPVALADAVAAMMADFDALKGSYERASRRFFDENYASALLYDRLNGALTSVVRVD